MPKSAVAVTQKHYIKLRAAKEGVAAMRKLEKAIIGRSPVQLWSWAQSSLFSVVQLRHLFRFRSIS